MENVEALQELAIIIFAGVAAAFIAAKLKLPTLVGYLLTGLVLGIALPSVGGSELTTQIAQVGAALLLFTVGVEFSIDTIKKVSRIVIAGSILQAVFVIVVGIIVLPLLGFSEYQSFFIAALVSTSSTVFVVKMLEAKDQLHTRSGNIMLGWLIMQDLLIVIWFLLFQAFAPNNSVESDLVAALLKGLLVIAITFISGKYLLPPLMKHVATVRSDELLVVSVVGVIAAFAVIANAFNISYTLGAFLAGLALSESFLNHEIFTEIKPIRNLFTMIFFVSIGTIFDVNSIVSNLAPLLVVLLVLLSFKVFVIIAINLWFKVHVKTALKVGLGISQIGEFAFLGAQLGLSAGWIDPTIYSLLIASTIISMVATPILYANADRLYTMISGKTKQHTPTLYRSLFLNQVDEDIQNKGKLEDHVIVCGYGRVGKYVVSALETSQIPYAVIELEATNVEAAKKKLKGTSIFGDASSNDILKQANIEKAKALVIALPDVKELDVVIKHAKELNPKIKIVARTHQERAKALDQSLVDKMVEPEFEAAVSIVTTLYKLIHRRYKRAVETVVDLQNSN